LGEGVLDAKVRTHADYEDPPAMLRHAKIHGVNALEYNVVSKFRVLTSHVQAFETSKMVGPLLVASRSNRRVTKLMNDVAEILAETLAEQSADVFEHECERTDFSHGPNGLRE
jgi:hypothetical protein